MIKYILLCFIILSPIKNIAQSLQFDKASKSWNDILQKAKKINKPIFVDVYTEWCGPCKWMDQNVFNQKNVTSFFEQNFLSVKIDAEKGFGPAFSRENVVGGYPTLLFFSPNGELILSGLGSLNSDILIQSGKKAIQNLKSGVSLAKLSDNPSKWNMKPAETEKYIKQLSIERKPNGALIEYFLNSIPQDSLYAASVFKMVTTGRFARYPVDGNVFRVLLHEYKKYPVKSGELMSAWNTIRNNLKNFADSAGGQNDQDWMNEVLIENDSLNNNLLVRKRERDYFQILYYSGSRDSINFVRAAKEFGEDFIINANEAELLKMDSSFYKNSLLIKFGKEINNKIKVSSEFITHKEVFMPESRILLDEILNIYYYLQNRFRNSFEPNKKLFQSYIQRALELYERNPVKVRQPFVDYVKKSILNDSAR